MRKILILNTTFEKGGAAKVAHTLFTELQESFHMYFAYGRGGVTSIRKTFYFGNKIEFFIHVFLVRFLGLEGYGSYFATKKLIKYIKKEKFDAINIHNLHGYYVNFFQLFSFLKKKKIKIIYTLHDEWAMNCLLAHSMGCLHCRTGKGKCTSSYKYPKTHIPILNRYMLEKKKKMFLSIENMEIICPSKWLMSEAQTTFLNKFDIKTIYNGIDTTIFKPTKDKDSLRIKYNIPLDRRVIVFSAANLKDKNKGIDFIFELAKNRKDFLFLGIGSGKLEYDNIVTTGYIADPRKLSEMYALSDVFICTSQAETFSFTCVEAMNCGLPIVALDVPVIREIISEGEGRISGQDVTSFIDNIQESFDKKNKKVAIFDKKYFLSLYNELFE